MSSKKRKRDEVNKVETPRPKDQEPKEDTEDELASTVESKLREDIEANDLESENYMIIRLRRV